MLIFNAPRTSRLWPRALLLGGLFSALAGSRETVAAQAAPPARPAESPRATVRVDNHLFNTLLQAHVVNGFVDYDAFARAPEFAQYLTTLDRVRPETLDEDERIAYWINVYNAYTIQLVVTHQETASIRNINKTLGVLQLKGPWSEPIVHAAGRTMSLDEVHHAMLRKQFSEARVHFALACGAIGCPPLRNEAYTGERLLQQFEDQARRFLRQSPSKNRVDGPIVYLSPVLMAYRGDFGPTRQDFGRALAPYFDGEIKARFEKGRAMIGESSFDWSLNSLAIGRARHLLGDTVRAP